MAALRSVSSATSLPPSPRSDCYRWSDSCCGIRTRLRDGSFACTVLLEPRELEELDPESSSRRHPGRLRAVISRDELKVTFHSAPPTAVLDALIGRGCRSGAPGALELLARSMTMDSGSAAKLISALGGAAEGIPRMGLELLAMQRSGSPPPPFFSGAISWRPLWRDADLGALCRPKPSRIAHQGIPRGAGLQAVFRTGLRDRAGCARAACRGPLEAVSTVPTGRAFALATLPRGVRAGKRSGGLPDWANGASRAGSSARDAPELKAFRRWRPRCSE